jgi:hypothetical protein
MRALLVALVLGSIAAPVAAADWWLIGANGRSAVFVDRSSIKRSGNLATQRVAGVVPNAAIRRIEAVERLDCRAGTARDLKVVYHLSNGRSVPMPAKRELRRLSPGTIGRTTLEFACGTDKTRTALGAPIGAARLEEAALAVLSSRN